MKRACKKCEFCGENTRGITECRRLPPTFSQKAERADGWPVVLVDEWCGEFEPRNGYDNGAITVDERPRGVEEEK